MRFLIVASVFACASAVPSGLLAPALPTISAGDINGAAIEAHVEASDHVRAAVDATRQLHDKVNELHGQAINNAEEQGWRAIDYVKTAEAQLDGAAAAAAPVLSKQLVRQTPIVAASYAAPVVAPYSAPLVAPYSAPITPYAAPIAPYAAPIAPYAAPIAPYAAPIAPYAAPSAPYGAPITPYSAFPNVVSPYYGSPLEYSQAW